MAGSELFSRTENLGGPQETEATKTFVHIAIAYDEDGIIRCYRNGAPYGKPTKKGVLATFKAGESRIVFGARALPPGNNFMLAGTIREAAKNGLPTTSKGQTGFTIAGNQSPAIETEFLLSGGILILDPATPRDVRFSWRVGGFSEERALGMKIPSEDWNFRLTTPAPAAETPRPFAMRHTISVLVENKFGVLTRIAGMFSGRGFNIDSLNVGPTLDPSTSRMTIVVKGDDTTLEQVTKQLNKLIDVIKIEDFRDDEVVERELVLMRVNVNAETRAEVMQIGDIFRAKIIDVQINNLAIEITGNESKIDKFLMLMGKFGITELTRTGRVALARKSD